MLRNRNSAFTHSARWRRRTNRRNSRIDKEKGYPISFSGSFHRRRHRVCTISCDGGYPSQEVCNLLPRRTEKSTVLRRSRPRFSPRPASPPKSEGFAMSSFVLPRRFLLVTSLFLVVSATLTSEAAASPLTVTYEGWGAGDVSVNISLNGQNYSGIAGQSYLKLSDGQNLVGFCIDIVHSVGPGQTYDVKVRSTNDGLTNGGKIAYLANTFGPGKLGPNHAAALQIAIWDELYNNGSTTGPFQYLSGGGSSIPGLVNYYLGQAQNNSATSTWLDASPSWTTNSPGQSMVIADPPAPSPVPEPSMLFIFAVGLGFVFISIRYASSVQKREPATFRM